MQGTQVWSLVQEGHTCHGATKLWAAATEPVDQEPVLCNKKKHRSEAPKHSNWRAAPTRHG